MPELSRSSPTQPFVVRTGRPSDGVTAGALFLRSVAHGLPYLRRVHTDEETVQHFGTVVFAGPTVVAVDADGTLLGFAAVSPVTAVDVPAGDSMPWLAHLYVDPPAQGQGVGSALFAAVCDTLPGGFRFWAFQRNARARRFYEARGCRVELETDGAENEEREPDVRYLWGEPASR